MIKTNCPICDAQVILPEKTEESEIISCSDCHTRLVVSNLNGMTATLQEAPKVEEDWGQ